MWAGAGAWLGRSTCADYPRHETARATGGVEPASKLVQMGSRLTLRAALLWQIEALKEFILSQGAGKNIVKQTWDKVRLA